MAKLPAEFTAADLHEKTFRYTDAVELLADMRRVRQRLGWTALWAGADDTQKRFRFHLTEEVESPLVGSVLDHGDYEPPIERVCGFEILAMAIYQNLWPSLYPDNKEVQELRRLFIDTPRGAHGIASLVNRTNQDPPTVDTGSDQSALDQLLDDDE